MAASSGSDDVRVEVGDESGVVRTLRVQVDARRVRKAYDRAYRDLARQARIPGFRPGKAPVSLLEKRFGAQVREEIERILVGETLHEAVEQSGLQPVTEPTVEAEAPEPGADFRYRAQLEVKPEIALPPLEGLPGKRPVVRVDEEDVDAEIERLRQARAELVEQPEGTAAAAGHVLRVDFVGRVDGKPFEGGSSQDVEVEIGGSRFLPGFAEQLEGSTAGEDREVSVTFPEDYGNPELAGKAAVFAVHVASVQTRELPGLDDEFAKDLGEFDTLEDLRTRIRDDLTARRTREARQALERSLLDVLVERTSFEVPPGLVERRLRSDLARAHRELEGSVPHEALHAQLDTWAESWRPRAEREVREALLLEAVADAQGIEAGEDEVEARITSLASEQNVDVARLRKLYRDNDLLEALAVQIRDERALDFLCAEAKVDQTPGT